MFTTLIGYIVSNLFYFALHVTSASSFPKPLSAAEERRLVALLESGDSAARDTLIEHNLRLVAHIVKKYSGERVEQDDLISIGTIGLIKAVGTFNSEKKIRLATYAARCIENEILMYFRSLKKSAQDVLISDPVDTDKDGNTLTLIDIISDDTNIVDEIDLKIKSRQLKQFLFERLDAREREILIYRYGLGGGEDMTQREVAKRLGISRSYVSRIEKKALEKLRASFNEPMTGRFGRIG